MLERYLKRLSRLWPAECWCWVCRWFSSCSGFWQWYQIQNTDTDWGLATDGWRQPSPGDPVHYCSLPVSLQRTLNLWILTWTSAYLVHYMSSRKQMKAPLLLQYCLRKSLDLETLLMTFIIFINCMSHRLALAPLAPITRVMYLCQPSISNVHFLSWPQYIYYNKFIISFVCFVLTLKHWSDVSIMLL